MTPSSTPIGTVRESSETRCQRCGAPIMAVCVQTDSGVSWGAVELWCGTYRPHQCAEAEREGVAA